VSQYKVQVRTVCSGTFHKLGRCWLRRRLGRAVGVGRARRSQRMKLETWGSRDTMNFNEILYQNVQASPYLRNL
jgi:hypothetical protein